MFTEICNKHLYDDHRSCW